MKVTVERLDDPAAFLAEWTDLAGRAGAVTPFHHPAWMRVWLRAAEGRGRLWIARGVTERTVALGVFGVARRRLRGGMARLAETNDADLDDVYVEYNDLLLAEDAPAEARRLVLGALFVRLPAQQIVLRNAPPPLRQAALAAGREAGWVVRVAFENPCYGRRLTEPAPLSRNARQQIGRARRLYEEAGALHLTVAATPEARAAAFPILEALHTEVWQARGEAGAFANETLRGFHADLLAEPDAPVELLIATCGGAPIGALHVLLGESTTYQYQSGFRSETDNRLKPGLVTHTLAMEQYAERGFAVYDMMAGESRYKRTLGEPMRRLSTIEMQRPGIRQKMRGVARNFRS